jgi:hypothetical protein
MTHGKSNRRNRMTTWHSVLKELAALSILIALLTGCASDGGVTDGPIIVEAEDAIYAGDFVINGEPDDGTATPIPGAQGDMLYLRSEGEIEFVFDVPVAGDYLIKLVYAVPASYGGKKQDVYVNGELVGNLDFPATGEPAEWTEKWVGIFSLETGEFTLTVAKSWGYTWYDYASIELVE